MHPLSLLDNGSLAFFFAEYYFEVKYKPGKNTTSANALSRRPNYELAHVTTMSSSIID